MTPDFPVVLALEDFVPGLLTALAVWQARLLVTDRRVMRLASGFLLIGGWSKAGWKLLVALDVSDWPLLEAQLFVWLAPGFLIAALGLRGRSLPTAAIPALMLIAVPLARNDGLQVGLLIATIAASTAMLVLFMMRAWRIARWLAAPFAISLGISYALGPLSSGDQASVAHNWLEQGLNTVSQAAFLTGVLLLIRRLRQFGQGDRSASGAYHGLVDHAAVVVDKDAAAGRH